MRPFNDREHIVALSYYQPWFGGGAHRPRQLMLADVAAGATVDFVFCSPTDLDVVRRNTVPGSPEAAYLLTADRLGAVRIGVDPDDDVEVPVTDLLPVDRTAGYVRAHSPARDLLPMMHLARARSVLTVYDQMSQWAGFAVQPWGDADTERAFLDAADVVVAATEQLAHGLTRHRAVHVIPNGVNDRLQATLADVPRHREAGTPPTVLYSGAMWPDWFDWALVFEVVSSMPDVRFVFLGALTATPDEDDGRPVADYGAKLADLPNVTMVDEAGRDRIADRLAAADVGLVPFVVNDVTNPCSPLTIFEYLAAGIPVVSTPLESLVGFPGVTLCGEAPQWRSAIRAALAARGDEREHARRTAFAADATWSARATAFQAVIDGHR